MAKYGNKTVMKFIKDYWLWFVVIFGVAFFYRKVMGLFGLLGDSDKADASTNTDKLTPDQQTEINSIPDKVTIQGRTRTDSELKAMGTKIYNDFNSWFGTGDDIITPLLSLSGADLNYFYKYGFAMRKYNAGLFGTDSFMTFFGFCSKYLSDDDQLKIKNIFSKSSIRYPY